MLDMIPRLAGINMAGHNFPRAVAFWPVTEASGAIGKYV
jgi:hypothetical protein